MNLLRRHPRASTDSVDPLTDAIRDALVDLDRARGQLTSLTDQVRGAAANLLQDDERSG